MTGNRRSGSGRRPAFLKLRCVPIYALGDVEPDIHPDAYVHPDAVVIGNVTIGAEASVWPTAVLRGDDGRIEIGARTSVRERSSRAPPAAITRDRTRCVDIVASVRRVELVRGGW